MKILCTSDIHRSAAFRDSILALLEKGEIDVFINSGDFLDNNFAYEFFDKLKTKSFIVPGNWDYGMEYESDIVSVDNFGIHEHGGYHFMCIGNGVPFSVEDMVQAVKDIPPEKLILITHYPPHGILDKAWSNTKAGFEEYTKFINQKNPILHVFGHIHESNGYKHHLKTLAVNAALADYGNATGYIVTLPEKTIKPVNLNEIPKIEKRPETAFRVHSTVSDLVRNRKRKLH